MKHSSLSIPALGLLCLVFGIEALAGSSSPDETRTIISAVGIAQPCLAVPLWNGVTASIRVSTLEQLATDRKSWKTEQERLELVASNRAKVLLDSQTTSTTGQGCLIVDLQSRKIKRERSDPLFLMADLIESGLVAVSTEATSGFVEKIQVTDVDLDCTHGLHGMKVLRIPGQNAFMMLTSCMKHPEGWQ